MAIDDVVQDPGVKTYKAIFKKYVFLIITINRILKVPRNPTEVLERKSS